MNAEDQGGLHEGVLCEHAAGCCCRPRRRQVQSLARCLWRMSHACMLHSPHITHAGTLPTTSTCAHPPPPPPASRTSPWKSLVTPPTSCSSRLFFTSSWPKISGAMERASLSYTLPSSLMRASRERRPSSLAMSLYLGCGGVGQWGGDGLSGVLLAAWSRSVAERDGGGAVTGSRSQGVA